MVGAGQPADALLHERAAEVVDAPRQRLGRHLEAHLHPGGLQAGDRAPEGQAEDRGVLEVLLARDLLDPVRAPQQRVEGDEGERDELGDPAGALLQRAHHAHVLGQLPRLLDVAEHHRRRRAQAGGVAGLDDLHPARDRQLVGADALAHAVVEDLGGGARRRVQAGVAQLREDLGRRQARRCRTCARSPSGCRRAGAAAARSPWPRAASTGSPRASSRDGCPTACRSRSRRSRRPRARGARTPRGRARRRRASACPARSRRTRSRRCRRWRR